MQTMVEQFLQTYGLHADVQTRYIDLVSEMGELGKEILDSTHYGKHAFSTNAQALDEMGDCLFSVLALCSAMNISAEDALNGALLKYTARHKQKGSIQSDKC